MQFDFAVLQVIKSVTQREAALAWNRLREGRPLPSLSEFDFNESAHDPRQLAFCLVENQNDRRRYRILHSGTQITEAYDSSLEDKYLDHVFPEDEKSVALAALDTCAQSCSLVYTIWQITDAKGKFIDCECLLLPFGLGTEVTQIVVSSRLISIEAAFSRQNILGGLTEPLQHSVAAIIKPGFTPIGLRMLPSVHGFSTSRAASRSAGRKTFLMLSSEARAALVPMFSAAMVCSA